MSNLWSRNGSNYLKRTSGLRALSANLHSVALVCWGGVYKSKIPHMPICCNDLRLLNMQNVFWMTAYWSDMCRGATYVYVRIWGTSGHTYRFGILARPIEQEEDSWASVDQRACSYGSAQYVTEWINLPFRRISWETKALLEGIHTQQAVYTMEQQYKIMDIVAVLTLALLCPFLPIVSSLFSLP